MSTAFMVKDFMTPAPHAIEPHETLDLALERMRQIKALHLPVRSAGRPVGMLSERDLGAIAGLFAKTGRTAELKTIKVMDFMTPDPYCVEPETLLGTVARQMADQKIGSALVVDATGKLQGIFTVTDALKALAALC